MTGTTAEQRHERKRLLKGDAFWIGAILIWLFLLAPLFKADKPEGDQQQQSQSAE